MDHAEGVREACVSVKLERSDRRQCRGLSACRCAGVLINPSGGLQRLSAVILALSLCLASGVSAQDDAKAAAPAGIVPPNVLSKHVTLSHTDPKRCLDMLKVFGYQTCEPGKRLDPDALPCVMVMPATTSHGLPAEGKKDFPQTDTDPVTDLLIFYDGEKPEQLSRVVSRIRSTVDLAARQIMIEAMVLEISSEALDQLGVEWTLKDHSTFSELTLGSQFMSNGALLANPTLTGTVPNLFGEFETELKALVTDSKARVLSRPSILTLDNRMAHINVSEKIPVAESKFAGDGNFTQVNFRDVTAGIELTVRPRASEDGLEVGMQIMASVTDRKPGEDVVIRTTSENDVIEVARAPTITIREVQTYARIANNTPFIIGGLIRKDGAEHQRRVPVLGKVPLFGALFRSRDDLGRNREVIIVITPHVLPDHGVVGRNMPKDVDDFDSFGAELFRDAYRIRSEDVFNLSFLTSNKQLRHLQFVADMIAEDIPTLTRTYPFRDLVNGAVPGEKILVYRQIYEVIKRRELVDEMDSDRFIFLTATGEEAGVEVDTLAAAMRRMAAASEGLHDVVGMASGDRGRRKEAETDQPAVKALALTFTQRDAKEAMGDVLLEPAPQMSVVECPDRDTWGKLLWEMNQPDPQTGAKRSTILLHSPKDLLRLKRTLLLRKAVELNAKAKDMKLRNFSMGRILLMPTVKGEKVYLIDREVASFFFYTEHYYRAVGRELRGSIEAFTSALDRHGLSDYLTMTPQEHIRKRMGDVEDGPEQAPTTTPAE